MSTIRKGHAAGDPLLFVMSMRSPCQLLPSSHQLTRHAEFAKVILISTVHRQGWSLIYGSSNTVVDHGHIPHVAPLYFQVGAKQILSNRVELDQLRA